MKTNIKLAILAIAAFGFLAAPAMADSNDHKKSAPAPAPVHKATAAPAATQAPHGHNARTSQTAHSHTNKAAATKKTVNSCASQKTPAAVRACNVSKGYPANAGSVVYLPADSGAADPAPASTGALDFPRPGVPMTNAQRGWSDDAPKSQGDSANGDTAYGEGHGGGGAQEDR